MPSDIEIFNGSLAKVLQTLRVDAGLSQEALAEQLRWDQATVSRIETGRRKVEVVELLAWLEETNAPAETMLRIHDSWRRRPS